MIPVLEFLYFVIDVALTFLKWSIFISVIASWLIAFNVVNPYNKVVNQIITTVNKIVDPLCAPFRRIMPDLGGIDLSPMVVVVLIIGVQTYLLRPFFNMIIAAAV